ncbi:MAG: FecR domain-containing protein [Deltaproteobacteria bacterium]|nr:FecR domain-containing protein [Deltaproteobacteria bacterium]
MHFKRSKLKVKTSSAVCGVRGSDFVVRATHKVTEVTTFEDTNGIII